MNIQIVIDEMRRQLAKKEKTLADLYPNNHRAGNFLDEAETSVRRIKIEYLSADVYDLKRLIKALEQCKEQV